MSWATRRLDELGTVVTGKTPATANPNFYDGGYMFVTPSDLEYASYYVTNTRTTVTDEARDSHKNQFIPRDSVMFTCIGNTIGKCGISSDECLTNQQINSIVVNGENNPKFIYYLLNRYRPLIRGIGLSGGAAQPIINKSTFSKVKVRAPDKRTQDGIAAALSAYDNLIENNQRRIVLLGEEARMLYREWFVHFRFPGHEHVEITDGLPEGWEWETLADIAETNKESYRVKELPDEINYIDISSVVQGRVVSKTRIPASEAPGRARRKIRDGDTIWSNVRPNLRAYALMLEPEEPDVVSTGFTVLTAILVPSTWLYMFVTTDNFVGHLVNHATGVGYPAVRPDDFERAVLPLPPRLLLDRFHEAAEPNFRLICKLDQQNQKLSEARDLLLPRLMNGEIAV